MRVPRSPNIYVNYRRERSISPFVNHCDKNLKNFVHNQLGRKIPEQGDLETIKNFHVLILDLSENKLTPKTLKNIGPNVTSLNLSRNPLNTIQLPHLERLRTLYLDDCNLISISRLPSFPNLRTLSLKNNCISDFKGIQYFPKLVTLNLLGNPVCKKCPLHLIVAAFGSLYLEKINQTKLDTQILEKAYELSPLVGYSLRKGRTPVSYHTEKEELAQSQAFLTKNLASYIKLHKLNVKTKLLIEESDGGYIINCPIASDSIKWYRHSVPDNGNEWIEIPVKKNSHILPINMSIRLHTIRCEMRIDKKKYSMYTDYPVGKGKKELSLPFPLNPSITGTPIEGSLLNCLRLPIPTNIAWAKESGTITKNTNQILLTNKEINQSVACVMQPYCKHNKLISFSTIFTPTDTVRPLYPMAGGIQFPETVMENESIAFTRFMYPDREGKSIIEIEKSFSPSGVWSHVETLDPSKTLKFTPKGTDVGFYLRLCYTPITDDGVQGETFYAYSMAMVLPSVPKFSNPFIAGVPKTGYPLVAIADYSGGVPGNCTCDWFFSMLPIDSRKGPNQRLQCVAHNTQYFTPKEDMAEGYLAIKLVPVRKDEVYGEPCFFAMDTPISLEDAPQPFEVPKEAVVGEKMRFPSVCDILLSKPTGFCGFDFLKTSDTYTPREKHIGRIVRVVNETGDMIIGPIKIAKPMILTAKISAPKWQVGNVASIEITHKNCKSDRLEILWLRVGPNYEKAVALNTPDYVIQPEDASFRIQAVVTPFDDENIKKQPFFSELSPVIKIDNYSEPVISGNLIENGEITIIAAKNIVNVIWYQVISKNNFVEIGEGLAFTLRKNDVGKFIRAKVILQNGIIVYTTTKSTVEPCTPFVSIELPKEVVEGDIIKPIIHYNGGVQGGSEQSWYRETEDGWDFVTNELNYKVTVLDVDCMLKIRYAPIRKGGEKGEEVIAECGPVASLPPTAKNVRIFQNEDGFIEVTGTYNGGEEGKSFIVWRAYDDKNVPQNIGKTCEMIIPPSSKLIGKTVDAVYVPIRFDGAAGQPVLSSNQIVVQPLPTVETAEILVKQGKVIEGSLMRCHATISQGAHAVYQWHHGDGKVWEEIKGATDAQYTPSSDDVGFYILCSVIAQNQKGWKSKTFAATTIVPVAPPEPKLKIVCSSEKVITGMLLSVNSDAKKKQIYWQREVENEWKTIMSNPEYMVTCNDAGHRIRAICSDGLESQPTNVIELEQILALYVQAMLRTSSLKFIGNPLIGSTVWNVTASPYGISMDTNSGKKKKSKWHFVKAEAIEGTTNEMALWLDQSSKYVMVPSFKNDTRLQSLIRSEQVRDYVVSVLNGIKKSLMK